MAYASARARRSARERGTAGRHERKRRGRRGVELRGVVLSAPLRHPEPSEGSARPTPPGFERVARLSDLDGRGLLGVELSTGERVCLIRHGDVVTAVRDLCSHQAFPLSEGEITAEGRLICAWHGAEFDCATGRVCRGPATETLEAFAVRVDGDDIHVQRR